MWYDWGIWIGAGAVGQHATTVGQWTVVGEQHYISCETDKWWNAHVGRVNACDTGSGWAKKVIPHLKINRNIDQTNNERQIDTIPLSTGKGRQIDTPSALRAEGASN